MSLEARLVELDRLRGYGAITEAEYQQGRIAALSAPLGAGAVAGVPLDPAGTKMELQTCRRGHPMTFGTMLKVATKRGQRELTAVPCFGCGRTVILPAQYYACHTCHLGYCEGCVAQRRNAPPPVWPLSFGSSLFGCFSDMGSCMDSVFYPCFLFHLAYPGTSGSAGCRAYCLGTFISLHELFFLGLPVALMHCQLRQRLENIYLHRDPESACVSCLTAWLCRCCSASQLYREMRANGHDVGGLCCTAPGPDRSIPINLPMGTSIAR